MNDIALTEIIKVDYTADQPTVSARELHEFLEVDTPYHIWFPRMCEYGFTDGQDFCTILYKSTGGRPAQDAALSIDMAKEICMLQRNEKGKIARQYFLQLEKAWNSPEQVYARALRMADRQIQSLSQTVSIQQQQIAELQPKASYYDLILNCKDAIPVTTIAKDYGWSAKRMNKRLHELGVQFRQGDIWLLYQKYAELGYTVTRTFPTPGTNGDVHSHVRTYWTQKGRLFLYDLLKEHGDLPLIEKGMTA